MNLQKEIKRIIYNINCIGRPATYNDVVKALPNVNVRTLTRLMQKMGEDGILKKPTEGKYVLPMIHVEPRTASLEEFIGKGGE